MKRQRVLWVMAALVLLAGCGKVENQEGASVPEPPAVVTESSEPVASAEPAKEEPGTESSAEDPAEGSTAVAAPEESPAEAENDLAALGLKDLCADSFLLGVGINGSTPENQCLNIPEYMEMSKEHFNSCTLTNLMKSAYILDQAGSKKNLAAGDPEPALTFDAIDPTLSWCAENGMKMRGHTLVWHTQAPGWFFREGYEESGSYVDRETMLLRMESYIRQLLTHVQEEYPGVIYCWDVVNEAVDIDSADPETDFKCRTRNGEDPNPWYDTIGPDYVEMAFTYARKYADPEVLLFYNDFNTFQAPKTTAIINLCKGLQEKGLIDGVGMQGYWGMTYPSLDEIERAIRRFSGLGLQIHITELSVSVDEETDAELAKQGEKYADIFRLLYKLDTDQGGPADITCITLFGLVDHYREGDTTNARIFDKNYEPKPAYTAIREVMEAKYR